RYRWYAMLVAWVLLLAGWGFVSIKPVTFTASAKIYVDTQTVLQPLLEGLALEKDTGAYLGLMVRELVSRPNLEQVAHSIGLDQQAKTPQDLEVALSKMGQQIRVDGSRASAMATQQDFFAISYPDNDPKRATQVVDALIANFVDKTVEESLRDSQSANRFLEQQIAEQKQKLSAAEAKIADFKRQHADALPEQGVNYFQRVQAAQAAIDDVDLQIIEAEYRRNSLQSQLTEIPATITGASAGTRTVSTATGSRIAALQARLDDLLLKYTEAHPDVIATRRSIKELKKQGDTTRSEVIEGNAIPNPVYQQLKVALSQIESETSVLRARRAEFSRRVQRLQERRETLTQVEAELQALNQEYEFAKQKLDALVARQGPATLSDDVDEAEKEKRFRVIDPPRVQETWPIIQRNRLTLTTMVLAAGIGGGLGVAFLLSQLWPAVYGRHALYELTGRPVFGAISQVLPHRVRWRKRLDFAAFVVIGTTLLAAHGAALFVDLSKLQTMLQSLGGAGVRSIEKAIARLELDVEKTPTREIPASLATISENCNVPPPSIIEDRDTKLPSLPEVKSPVELDWRRLSEAGYLTPKALQSKLAEEYRLLKRTLLLNANATTSNPIENINVVTVTSALAGEGKTFTAFNLAMNIAIGWDTTVILLDGDLVRRSLTSLLGLADAPGLTDVLLDTQLALHNVIVQTTVPGLRLIPAGRPHPDADELLASERMQYLTDELATRYTDRIVLLDAPPLLASTQALALTTLAGQVLIVVEEGRTPQKAIKEAAALLDEDKVVGMVLNKCWNSSGGQYYIY
ncbi:MAG: AAA family ATPase, partial [Candidatus Competibacteraceae bacterium]|nr:AAA family ATPase [Candidatus Competibacteraceae bacterium]